MTRRKRGLRGLSMNDRDLLAAALVGYGQQRVEIERKIAELRHQLGERRASAGASSDGVQPARKKRTMSVAGRKRIAAAQRKRWAAAKKLANRSAAPAAKSSKKRTMSAAGRKRIAEATQRRWAAFRAKKSQSSQAAKTTGA